MSERENRHLTLVPSDFPTFSAGFVATRHWQMP